MHSIAHDLYSSTQGTKFRNRITDGGEPFPFDAVAHTSIENEYRIVGMVMVWSVVTLESLVNHQIAVTINNKTLATLAIEYPAQVTNKLGLNNGARSELAKKLIILTDGSTELSSIADGLAEKRNHIVHDKPFELIDHGDGEVETRWVRSRGDSDPPAMRYDDLSGFFADCDCVAACATDASSEPLDCDINFGSLLGR